MEANYALLYKAYIIGMTCTHNGIAVRIQFSTARSGKNIVWEYSKRLVAGSVVALTPSNDCFRTKCVVAIVAARPLDGVKNVPSEVDLFFTLPEDMDFDTQKEWTMIEAKSGYYESARHTLTALQKMTKEK
jgi:helicase required for RNAi-mediated heterochromatin assembly 1